MKFSRLTGISGECAERSDVHLSGVRHQSGVRRPNERYILNPSITVEIIYKLTDAYPAFGGYDAAPSPLFYALGSLTSCNQVTATLVAKDLGITLGAWSFEVQGDLDTSVLVGGADGNANFDRVSVRAAVETDATDEQFATLISETERRCPVTQLFKRSGVEWDNEWTKAPLPAAS